MPLPKNIQPNAWKGEECMRAFESASPQLRIHCYKTAEPLFRNGTTDHFALFHFATKSADDFKNKMARGSGMSLRAKGYDYFNEILKCVALLHLCTCSNLNLLVVPCLCHFILMHAVSPSLYHLEPEIDQFFWRHLQETTQPRDLPGTRPAV